VEIKNLKLVELVPMESHQSRTEAELRPFRERFRAIRLQLIKDGIISPSNREIDPYKYTVNGSRRKERGPGRVALAIYQRAIRARYSGPTMPLPSCSWDGSWPRTQQSIRDEVSGVNAFWDMVNFLGL